jgi:hypothetical protein
VQRARTGDGHIILTEDEAPAAAIIGIDALRELQQADDADIALCRRSRSSAEPRLPTRSSWPCSRPRTPAGT